MLVSRMAADDGLHVTAAPHEDHHEFMRCQVIGDVLMRVSHPSPFRLRLSRCFFWGGGRPYFLLAMAWGLSASTWRRRKLTLGRLNDGCKEALQHWRCT